MKDGSNASRMLREVLLVVAVNAVLVGYLGPLFKLSACSYDSNLFDKRACVVGDDASSRVTLGTLAYVSALGGYFIIPTQSRLALALCLSTALFSSLYGYCLSSVPAEYYSTGFYAAFVGAALFLTVLFVYKLPQHTWSSLTNYETL